MRQGKTLGLDMIDFEGQVVYVNNEAGQASSGAGLVGLLAAAVIQHRITKEQVFNLKRVKRKIPLLGCFNSWVAKEQRGSIATDSLALEPYIVHLLTGSEEVHGFRSLSRTTQQQLLSPIASYAYNLLQSAHCSVLSEMVPGSTICHSACVEETATLLNGKLDTVICDNTIHTQVSAFSNAGSALKLVQVVSFSSNGAEIVFLTSGTQGQRATYPERAGIWGIARTARLELQGSLICGCVDLYGSVGTRLIPLREPEMLIDAGLQIPILCRHSQDRKMAPTLKFVDPDCRRHLVTGGNGGLGLLVSQWLVQSAPSCKIIGVARTGKIGQGSEDHWLSLADAQTAQITMMLGSIAKDLHMLEICTTEFDTTLHCAGTLSDALLQNQTMNKLEHVWVPKVQGAVALHACVDTKWSVLFSSISGLLGNIGQVRIANGQCTILC